ncbi:Fe(3+)-hydroxamate ABC transporter permease FhuB [Vibrio porteresiae]|uniref:Fe(3+)-hydroxamate ABC transporter permease FhuB n=1 Tax=Vibrio porteresiae DSM 19223 TaxID=1123496 RepID=A0ABZ0QIW9_9VIBR|nr:Fe(3+)-hydroxamate ABC transporter permease FhuB [Vibrio porteresiae]WPC76405.1 Fe(3+)-hydroxamate ABC transporter permease FhuB [Vibrio porteresiae DSM 19223]
MNTDLTPIVAWQTPVRRGIGLLILCVALLALLQFTAPYAKGLPLLWNTLFHYNPSNYQHLITYFTYLPRLTVALLCGFSLAIAGNVMQLVLRNPIASPTTLGVAAGAELGKVLAILILPTQWLIPDFIPAFFGGIGATALVFLLSKSRGYAPLHMVLSGMVISLFLGSLNTMLLMLHEQQLSSVFVWGAGILNQTDWSVTQHLLMLTLLPVLLLMCLQRPLASLQFGDAVASSIGVHIKQIKIISLSLAVFMTAAVVSEVGLIGFIGIVAPAISRILGVRSLSRQLLVSGTLGALLLLVVDLIVQPLSGLGGEQLPTGAMTALIGAPFLLWLLHSIALQSDLKMRALPLQHYRSVHPGTLWTLLSLGLLITVSIALLVGKDSFGWSIDWSPRLFDLRAPRVAIALLAGIGLAIAGLLIQRISSNPMASPEVLGISSGAALSLVLGTLFSIAMTREQQMLFGTLGALLATAIIAWMGKKHQFAPTQTLLAGIGLSAGLDALLRIALASGHDNATTLLTWLSGSTYLVENQDVWLLAIGVGILGGLALLLHRWIDIIGLGSTTAQSVGLPLPWVRGVLLLIVAALTTLCTIVLGPLSFVGLLAPHMARTLHQYRAKPQMITAALLGSLILVGADWVGRTWWYPWQFPAGLLASLFGGGYFLYLMRR